MSEQEHNTDDHVAGSAESHPVAAGSVPGTAPAPTSEHESSAADAAATLSEAEAAVSEEPHATASPAEAAEADDAIDAAAEVIEEIEEELEDVKPLEEIVPSDDPPKMDWYILKVQSNREDSIREGLQHRVAMAGLDKYFGDIIVPTEMVSEFKGGKKRVVKRKLYPGYLVVHMEINEDTWFLVRETPGIGDFTGSAGKPTPMSSHEIAKIVAKQEEKTDEAPKLKIDMKQGDRVKINEGTFENFEGDVDAVDMANGRVTVMINIFGRSTPVELEYWQIEKV